LVIAVEFFVVKPFFDAWLLPMQIVHNLLLGAGIGVFVVGETLHAWHCRRTVNIFSNGAKRGKAKK
jgi:hypothetical protein